MIIYNDDLAVWMWLMNGPLHLREMQIISMRGKGASDWLRSKALYYQVPNRNEDGTPRQVWFFSSRRVTL